MKRSIFHILLIGVIFSSCQQKNLEVNSGGLVAAKVFDRVLYDKDVLKAIPSNSTAEDSVSIRNSIINSWVNRALMVKQAEANLPEELKNVDQKLEKYRQDLLIYSYQNQLLSEKLDTVVADSEVEAYYADHKEMFNLADYIIKARFVQLDSTATSHKKLRGWLMSNSDEDFELLDEYCYMHSANFYLEDNWIYLDELLKQVPIVTYKKEKLLKNKKLIEVYENGYLYLVRIVDYKLKDGISPIALERNNIKRIILNNRKVEFLNHLSEDIYQNAKNQNQIEISIP